MVLSAIQSTELAIETGLRKDQIIISCKVSRPRHLIDVYRALAKQTDQPLHLGLTEAGMGTKGLVWSASAMGVLLADGIGDTIRVSLTPRPGGDRREEVYAACELLQALGLRAFAPSVTACPGCGRTTSSTFQELAEAVQGYIRERMPEWKTEVRRRRNTDIGRHGLRRQRARGIKGRQHRHLAAGNGRSAELPGVHRRRARDDAEGHLRRARTSPSTNSSTSTSIENTRRKSEVHCVTPGISIRHATPADRDFVIELAERLVSFDVPAWREKPELVEGDRRALTSVVRHRCQ